MTKSQISFCCLLILLFTGNFVNAQERAKRTLNGSVTDKAGNPIAGATLLLRRSSMKASANKEGVFHFEAVPKINDELQASHVGYKTQVIKLKAEMDQEIKIVLDEEADLLNEVEVTGKSENQRIAEQPVLTQVISTKGAQEQPNTLIELLNRSSGIRIRQTGGVGSSSNITINGFQNRSVRYFKDGIPMDYLGGGFDLSLVPVNMLDHVEVYKGVLPVALGADALGGAINMVTKKSYQN